MSAPPSTQRDGNAAREVQDRLVTCPHCGQQFPLTAAFAEELASHVLAGKEPALREQIVRDLQTQHAVELQAMQYRRQKQE